ncbi:MAG: hypothetical protein IKC31_00250 [Clostridia bacterium]|nr:hypothetical protein [Clostridia bacterium]
MTDRICITPPLRFLSPIDGDVLFREIDGTEENGVLTVPAVLCAPSGTHVTVNGIPAKEGEAGRFCAEVPLCSYRTELCAECEQTGQRESISVFWFRNGYRTYRVGVDDVIFSLRNIWEHQKEYGSVFDDPFFALFLELHQTFGTHVHMHLYYETVDRSFNLSMFPDKYRSEFAANADWLRLSFHSRADLPDSPYKNAPYGQVMEEGRMVEREIERFAGKEVLDRVTSQHWADSSLEATRAFRDLGFSVLDAYFLINARGEPAVSYYLSVEQTKHAQGRDFWVDTKEDLIFVKDDIILDTLEPERIRAHLDAFLDRPDRAFMYLLIHEQYFYPEYHKYLPDYRERLFTGVRWCEEHGYRSSWISDFAFGVGDS